ncbi:MAG: NAD(P)H-hydrate dehydratase, partial [Desulfonatronovibrionaceae bacterium]
EAGILPEILMENASREALNIIKYRFDSLKGLSALIFAGSGNNGGDAFALARHLWNLEVKVMILHSKRLKEYQGASAYHLSLVQTLEIPLMYLHEYNLDFLKGVDIIVDGLLGTGFRGQLRDEYSQWIRSINKLGEKGYVISLDIPSGVNGITGKPSPVAVRADDTISFEEAKLGLFQPEAREYAGCLSVGKIGIPKKIKTDNPPQHFGLSRDILTELYPPKRTMHKGQAGHVLIIGGSREMSGAALLSALGGLRSGAGLVTIACPRDLAADIRLGWPEIMVLPLGSGESWQPDMMDDLAPVLDRFSSVAVGPGMGRTQGVEAFLDQFVQNCPERIVFDADALYFLALRPEIINKIDRNLSVVFTPHPGELARFFHEQSSEINRDRTGFARKFIYEWGFNLVLKGACTIVAARDQPFYVSPFAVPCLAAGGSGDVLTGIIASLLGRGLPVVDACNLAVCWHGQAGRDLENKFPFRGNLAREISDELPHVLARLTSQEQNPDAGLFFDAGGFV